MQTKTCPFCAETIVATAAIFPLCQRRSAQSAPVSPATTEDVSVGSPCHPDSEDHSKPGSKFARLDRVQNDEFTFVDTLIDTGLVVSLWVSVQGILCSIFQYEGDQGLLLYFMPPLYCAASLRKRDSYATSRKRLLVASVFVGLICGAISVIWTWVIAQHSTAPIYPTKTIVGMAFGFSLFFWFFSPVHALIGNWLCKWAKRQ